MATSADVDAKPKEATNAASRERGGVGTFMKTMIKRPEICFMIVAISLTLLSRYAKSSDGSFTSQPPPRSFFPSSSSVVLDFPYGNLDDVFEIVAEEEVLVVMYYAPWCATSMRFRDEFVRAAEYMKEEVSFVAVNCWHPDSQCKRTANLVRYPVICFYHTNLREFYYKGLLTAEHLVDFVQQLLIPYTHIRSPNQLAMFLAHSDNSVIGYFDLSSSPQPPGFEQFYYAAMRIIETEPRNQVKVGLVTERKLATEFEIHRSPSILLVRSLNGTVQYPNYDNVTSSGLVQWVFSAMQQPLVKWILPRGMKTLRLSTEINKGPALILFTPDMPLIPSNQITDMLREVALDYNNCRNSTRVRHQIKASIYLRWRSFSGRAQLTDACRSLKPLATWTVQESTNRFKHCCEAVCVGSSSRFNSCDICFNYERSQPLRNHGCVGLASDALSWQPVWSAVQSTLLSPSRSCGESAPTYNPGESVSFCCGSGDNRDPLLNRKDHDTFMRESHSRWHHRQCRKLHLEQTFGWLPAAPPSNLSFAHNYSEMAGISGLRCRASPNRTLNFYAMDLRRSYMFLEKLGVRTNQNPVAVIFDKKNEAQYVLEDVDKLQLAKFIENFTTSDLTWFRRSMLSEPVRPALSRYRVTVTEVTGDTFQQVVMREDVDVVLLYYAPWCGFCASFAHIYLSLARYFTSAKDIVFARINADRNDLAWQFTMDVYPTITFFPASRKSESVTFPEHLKKSLPNLIEFILHYSSPSVRTSTALATCTQQCFDTTLYTATARVATVRSDIDRLQHRVTSVSAHLQNLAGGNVAGEDSALREVHSDVLRRYLLGLETRLRRQRDQLTAVTGLYDVLVHSNGDLANDEKLGAFIQTWRTERTKGDKIDSNRKQDKL